MSGFKAWLRVCAFVTGITVAFAAIIACCILGSLTGLWGLYLLAVADFILLTTTLAYAITRND